MKIYRISFLSLLIFFLISQNTYAVETVYPENLDDTFVTGARPAADYGTFNRLFAGGISPSVKESYLKFDLSQIPVGSTVYNANLSLFMSYHNLESDDVINVTANFVYAYPLYSINGQEWSEGNSVGGACTGNELCWSTMPTSSQMNSVPESGVIFDGATIQLNTWSTWTVTDMIRQAVNNGDRNVTIRLSSTSVQSAVDSMDTVQFDSKEYSISSQRPVLVVTYSEQDTIPPLRSNPQPTGSLPSGTTQATISLNTNENANCRYSEIADIDYYLMTNFDSTGLTYHSTLVTDLNDGNSYSYYIRCGDLSNNVNTDNFVIQFNIQLPDLTPPVISNLAASPSQTSSVISWATDDLSNSTVDYGLTPSLGLIISDFSFATDHSVTLTSLSPDTLYYYQVTSCNQDGYCSSSSIDSFATLPLVVVNYQRIKGTTYKPNYGNETVEFVVVVMDNKTSIEGNVRFVGTDDWNVSYRVINPDSSLYQDWKNITINYSWGLAAFDLLTSQSGTFTIELKLANETTNLENITFSVSGSNTIPFYRDQIIKAADFVVSVQSPNGSFPGELMDYIGPPAMPLMWAYRITGNSTYYDAAVNYLEDQIDCASNTIYGTCTYAEFQLFSNDAQFENNLAQCSQNIYDRWMISSEQYFEKAEGAYCLYEAWEASGNFTFKDYADDLVDSVLTVNSWNENKNTWYWSDQTYVDGVFTATLSAFALYWNSNTTYLDNAIKAQNLFVPQLYQDSTYGPWPTRGLYSFEIVGPQESGHNPHFTAEPAIAMLGIYNATGNREWLLKAALPAKWVAESQEPDGRFVDDQSPSNDIWTTMWSIWSLYRFPWEVYVEVVDKNYNLTISDAGWNAIDRELWANTTVPSGEEGKIRFTIPENENLGSVLIDGISTTSYIQNGRNVVVDVTEGNHVVEVVWGDLGDVTPPLRSNPQPTGSLPSGTTQATISLNTNENATCRYSTVIGVDYDLMNNTFSSIGSTYHSTLVTGLSDGNSYSYYIRCSDLSNNVNTDNFVIQFNIQLPDLTPPVISNLATSPSQTSSVISWTTDDLSNSTVDYGLTPSLGLIISDFSFATDHSVTLNNLSPSTLYYYQVISCNQYGYCNASSINSFVTLSDVLVETVYPENLDDTFVTGANPTVDYGTFNRLFAGGITSSSKESYLKFDLSQIPVGSTVYNANLSLFMSYHNLESDDVINVTANFVYAYPLYSINSQEWSEGDSVGGACVNNELCWSTRPTSSQMNSVPESWVVFDGATIQLNTWSTWTVTDMIQQSVNNGDNNVTIRFSSTSVQSAVDSMDIVQFDSKEYSTSSLRPILAISYGT